MQIFLRFMFHRPVINQTQFILELPVQEDVLSNREIGHQGELLIDGRNPLFQRVLRRVQMKLFPLQENFPLFRDIGSQKALRQGALAGPVLPQQDVHLSRPQVKVNMIQRFHGRKIF